MGMIDIPLIGGQMLTIDEDEWPIIAESWAFSSLRSISVYRHADGRTLVYGEFRLSRRGEPECCGGVLVPAGGDIVAAIRTVAAHIYADSNLVDRLLERKPDEPSFRYLSWGHIW